MSKPSKDAEFLIFELKSFTQNDKFDYGEYTYDPELSKKEALIRNSTFVTCDRCGVVGNAPNMSRWHFKNCTTIIRKCKQCNNDIPRQGTKNYHYDKKIFCNRKCYMKSKLGKSPIVMTEEVREKISKSAQSRSSILSQRMKDNKVWLQSRKYGTGNNKKQK